jgi:endonuclease-3 related protein
MNNNSIQQRYLKLLANHGHPAELWPQWCDQHKTEALRQLVAIGAILTQRTSWHNAHLALVNLKSADLLSLDRMADVQNLETLTQAIKPAGFHTTKPRRLQAFSRFVQEQDLTLEQMRNTPVDQLRPQLLDVYGIGPETADTILLYALDLPSFVIDEYTRRFVAKYELADPTSSYDDLKQTFEAALPHRVEVYQNYHILIIVDQKGKQHSLMAHL